MTYIKQSVLQPSERVVETNSDSRGQRPNLFKSVEGNFPMIYTEGLKENYIFIAALLQVMPCVGSSVSLDTEQWCLSNFRLFLSPSEKSTSPGLEFHPRKKVESGGKSVVRHLGSEAPCSFTSNLRAVH